MKRLLIILIALMVLMSFTVWAGGHKESVKAASSETGKVVVSEWKIPFLNCLTGPIASIGEYLEWGAERAAYEINKAGGIAGKPVKIIGIDTAMDPAKGTVEMAKVVKDSLVALGPVPEPVIMASMPIAVESKMMSFTATTSLEYAEKFFPWSISWFSSTEGKLPPVVTAWAKQFPDMKKVVQFVEPYGPWPGMAKAHRIGLKKAGVEPLKDVTVPRDAITFGPLVVKALEQKPDGIIFVCQSEKVAKIIKELKNRGWKDMGKLLIFNSADDAPLYTTGGSALNGVMIYNYINPNIDSPRWDAFKKAYAKDHNGMSPPSLSTHYYDAVYMIKEAIEKTGVTGDPKKLAEERKKIADYCRNVKNFHGLMFTWSMKDGIPTNKPLFLFKIENGKKILVKEVRE
ncbi:MAG: amino acid ABC transporter substrate-binding protein [Spirochaetes bacterium]|nr:amino acid ABC transporter substrate-binding protein [Spirochaetota bacterium]